VVGPRLSTQHRPLPSLCLHTSIWHVPCMLSCTLKRITSTLTLSPTSSPAQRTTIQLQGNVVRPRVIHHPHDTVLLLPRTHQPFLLCLLLYDSNKPSGSQSSTSKLSRWCHDLYAVFRTLCRLSLSRLPHSLALSQKPRPISAFPTLAPHRSPILRTLNLLNLTLPRFSPNPFFS